MPADDSSAILVARFLRANHYTEDCLTDAGKTLDAYLEEAGLPSDAGQISKGCFTIEKLLDEKRAYDTSTNFEKLGIDNERKSWNVQYPACPILVDSLASPANVLDVSFAGQSTSEPASTALVATFANRSIVRLQPPDLLVEQASTTLQDAPILSYVSLEDGYFLCTSMSGQLVLADGNMRVVDKRRDHNKYTVKVATMKDDIHTLVATAAWDGTVKLYRLKDDEQSSLPTAFDTISLPSNPEAIILTRHPDSMRQTVLIVTRRDSSYLDYYSIGEKAEQLGRQNLAPLSNAWVAFTPCSIALCPTDPTLLAAATSSLPHMKLLIVRLRFPPLSIDSTARAAFADSAVEPSRPAGIGDPSHATVKARADLAIQDREANAIQVHVSTMAPQTQYSTPALAWRPDGSGVWVNSDDGIIRGFESSTGKLMTTLGGIDSKVKGHEPGSKIRCLAASYVDVGNGKTEEWLVTGGFDQRLIIWKPDSGA